MTALVLAAAVLAMIAALACLATARAFGGIMREQRLVLARLQTSADAADAWVASLVGERERWERERRQGNGA